MSYYRAGDIAAPGPADLGYSNPEVPIPDPLADDETRLGNLIKAYERMKESDMGYYRAGDSGSFGVLQSDMNPAPDSGGGDVTYITPARQRQLDSGGRRHHRMNVGNVRALRKAMRRVTGFTHLAKRLMTFTAHHKMKKARKRK